MRSKDTVGCLLLVMVLGLALALVLVVSSIFAPSGYSPEQERRRAAEADRAELQNETYDRTQDARVAALEVVFVGGALVLVLTAVGLAYAGITKALTSARTIYPNAAGQMPLVKIQGPGWSGYLDPNRSPGAVTVLKSPSAMPRLAARLVGELPPPQVLTPLSVSEPATVQVTAQATALGMTAAATRHPSSSRANVMGAVESVAVPRVSMGPRPLPQVETMDPTHVDRLLMLTDADVTEGEYRELD